MADSITCKDVCDRAKRKELYPNVDNLNRILDQLRAGCLCRVDGWTGRRLSDDMHKTRDVQVLLDFAVRAVHTLDNAKGLLIDFGHARYNEKTGKFEVDEPHKDEVN